MSYQEFPEDVEIGDVILIDDGKIKLEVTETNHIDSVKARVIHSGFLASKKGVSTISFCPPNSFINASLSVANKKPNLVLPTESSGDWVFKKTDTY